MSMKSFQVNPRPKTMLITRKKAASSGPETLNLLSKHDVKRCCMETEKLANDNKVKCQEAFRHGDETTRQSNAQLSGQAKKRRKNKVCI